ncbi:MAG: sugar phosphate isomerase/epimerase [Phycisphaeraceae bacterium]|nr:sugar phosphate isomerase/epimerase [Phycisphaeraceae bacterium]
MSWPFSAFADEAGKPIDQQIAALLDAGLHYIDLRNVGQHNIVDLPLDEAHRVKAALDEAQIRVCMFGSPIGKLDIADDFAVDQRRLEHLAQLAPILDCRWVRIFSYYNKQNRAKTQWQAESLQRLSRLRDIARKHNLVLYHENERHIFGDRCPEVIVITDALRDGKNFKIIFDFDNFNQSGDDVWDCWLKLRDRVDCLHFKDSTAPPNPMHVPLGQGNGKVRAILADARDRGWTGPVILEPHLARSAAVLATGPSGIANQALSDLTSGESFQLAADTAQSLLAELGIDYC